MSGAWLLRRELGLDEAGAGEKSRTHLADRLVNQCGLSFLCNLRQWPPCLTVPFPLRQNKEIYYFLCFLSTRAAVTILK